ncbi:MAG TPA: hypothetical protein VMK12_13920, partial [Anaeromyxobacteraceae bacterium]|nr:hypothetical protein [Anaeromyxobacteraceae bacterium]
SCSAQVLVHRHDLRVVEVSGGEPGNRNDRTIVDPPDRDAAPPALADGGHRGIAELLTPAFQRKHCARVERL